VPEPKLTTDEMKQRTMWLPNMHPIGGELYAAALRGDGFKVEPLPLETRETFDLGRSLTRGSECLPTACTTGSFVHMMQCGKLDPEKQAIFMPGSDGPCRFGQYGLLQRLVLNRKGMGEVAFLSPSCRNSYQGLSQKMRRSFWQAILSADILLKTACKIRPYEQEPGSTDAALDEEVLRIADLLEKGHDVRQALEDAVNRIASLPVSGLGSRPLVGIVGEIYVRCNPFANDQLIRSIERLGGEAWLAPISEWILYTVAFQQWSARQRNPWHVPRLLEAYLKNKFLTRYEHEYTELAMPFLADRIEPNIEETIAEGRRFLPMNFAGEAIITLGRAVLFARQGAALVVNVAPFGCMPGTITSALCREVQAQTKLPVISLFYDGETGVNQRLEVFLTALTTTGSTLATIS